MGYRTEFEGCFKISPPLDEDLLEELWEFCSLRHNADAGMPSVWCDWDFNRYEMFWNGSEKPYKMVEWANLIDGMFLEGHTLTGEIRARGEKFDDVWTMVADGGVRRVKGWK